MMYDFKKFYLLLSLLLVGTTNFNAGALNPTSQAIALINENEIAQKAFLIVEAALFKNVTTVPLPICDIWAQVLSMVASSVQEHSLSQEKVFVLLQEKIEARIAFYRTRIIQKYDYKALAKSGGLLAVGLTLGYITAKLFEKIITPYRSEFKAVDRHLEHYGVTVKRSAPGLLVFEGGTPKNLAFIEESIPLLLDLQDKELNTPINFFTLKSIAGCITAFGCFHSIKMAYEYGRAGFSPSYEKYLQEYQELLEVLKAYTDNMVSDIVP